jgi:hypothetical protein
MDAFFVEGEALFPGAENWFCFEKYGLFLLK